MSSRSFYKLVEQPKINKMNWDDLKWGLSYWVMAFYDWFYKSLLMFPSVFIDDIICKSVFLNWILAYDEQWVRRALLRNSRVWTKKVLQRFCDEGKKLCSVTDSDNCLCVKCSINSFKCVLKHVISLETK